MKNILSLLFLIISSTSALSQTDDLVFECDCEESIVSKLLFEGFEPVIFGQVTLSPLNNTGGIVDEFVHITAGNLDVNSDITNYLTSLSQHVTELKGIIQSLDDCDDEIETSLTQIKGGSNFRNPEFLMVVHVISTKNIDNSDVLWVKIYDTLPSIDDGSSTIYVIPLNDTYNIVEIDSKMHEFFDIMSSSNTIETEIVGAVNQDELFDKDVVMLIGSGGVESEIVSEVRFNYDHIVPGNFVLEDFAQKWNSTLPVERGSKQLNVARTDFINPTDVNKFGASSGEEFIAFNCFHACGHSTGIMHWKCNPQPLPIGCFPPKPDVVGQGFMDNGICLQRVLTGSGFMNDCDSDSPCPDEVNQVCSGFEMLINNTDVGMKNAITSRFNN